MTTTKGINHVSSTVPDNELDTGIDPAEGINEMSKDAPVYDERGNVRPRGTKGAKHMTYAERVALAAKLAEDTGDKPANRARRTARKAAAAKAK